MEGRVGHGRGISDGVRTCGSEAAVVCRPIPVSPCAGDRSRTRSLSSSSIIVHSESSLDRMPEHIRLSTHSTTMPCLRVAASNMTCMRVRPSATTGPGRNSQRKNMPPQGDALAVFTGSCLDMQVKSSRTTPPPSIVRPATSGSSCPAAAGSSRRWQRRENRWSGLMLNTGAGKLHWSFDSCSRPLQ